MRNCGQQRSISTAIIVRSRNSLHPQWVVRQEKKWYARDQQDLLGDIQLQRQDIPYEKHALHAVPEAAAPQPDSWQTE